MYDQLEIFRQAWRHDPLKNCYIGVKYMGEILQNPELKKTNLKM